MTYILWNASNPVSLIVLGVAMLASAVGILVASATRRRHDYRQLCGQPGPALVKYLISSPPLPPPAAQAVVGAAVAGAAVTS